MSKKWYKKHQNQKPSNDSDNPADHCEVKWPVVQRVSIEPKAEDEKRYSKEQFYKRSQRRTAIALNWITIGAAMVALAGLVYLFGTLDATRESVKQARDNAHIDKRAWVSIKSVKLASPYSSKANGQVAVDIANNGKTPALRTSIARAGFGDSINPSYVAAQETISMPVGPGSTDDELFIQIPARDSTARLYLRFQIEYWDIFQMPSEQPHITTFCGYYPGLKEPFFFNYGCGDMN